MATVDSESKSVSGFPFGSTAIDGDTGFRYRGREIHVARDFVKRDVWRIYATSESGNLPQDQLLDKPEGEPLGFETQAAAFEHATKLFRTVGNLLLGAQFQYAGRKYMRICVPNWKTQRNFVPVLDLESFTVSEMHCECKPTEQPQCEPSSSVVASSQPAC